MTHPHRLHAIAALHSLRAAIRHLAVHRDAVLIRRPQLGPAATRPRTLAQLQEHDQLLREERAEIAAGSLRGLKPFGSSPSPVAPGLLDLERTAHEAVAEAAQVLAWAHWSRRPLLDPSAWITARRGRLSGLWAYCADALTVTGPDMAAAVTAILGDADARLRAVCGVGPDHWVLPLSPPCPACQERRLRVQTSAALSSAWTVVCTGDGCRCLGDGQEGAGDGCPCGMPVRVVGVRHIWAADSALAVSAFAGAALTKTAA